MKVYPHYGTCDSCAQGDRPLRETDPEYQAWICEKCDARHDTGVAVAAEYAGVSPAIANAVIETYFKAIDEDIR